MKIRRNTLFMPLRFPDATLESEFDRYRELETRAHLRVSAPFALLGWSIAMGLAAYAVPGRAAGLALLIALTVWPLYGFILFATRRHRYLGVYRWLGFVANTGSGLLAIVICGDFPVGEWFTLAVLVLVMVVGGHTLRLNFTASLGASALYLLGYQVTLLFEPTLAAHEFAMMSFIIWMALLGQAALGYSSERTGRVMFLQRRRIREQRAHIRTEQRKAEDLLLNMLPASIARRLQHQPGTIADNFENISVLFADIVDFTALAEHLPPQEVVALLNDIFSRFDRLAEEHDLEKIKTIGDAYMIAGGLPGQAQDHAAAIADLALDMQREVTAFNRATGHDLDLRIGIHTGRAVAGVIGSKRYAYDIWGDTVNTAARMESHGLPGCIQATADMHRRLRGRYLFEERGVVMVKGKGAMRTFFLRGRPPVRALPSKTSTASAFNAPSAPSQSADTLPAT
ncbi:MAG: adenylate/guanylate cyclase domain-containing protein [Gammaproteobacteria bacterium]